MSSRRGSRTSYTNISTFSQILFHFISFSTEHWVINKVVISQESTECSKTVSTKTCCAGDLPGPLPSPPQDRGRDRVTRLVISHCTSHCWYLPFGCSRAYIEVYQTTPKSVWSHFISPKSSLCCV